jgi:hypothetical protein
VEITSMKTLKVGDVTISSIIERDGPWRRPEDMFPAYDPKLGKRHLAELDPFVFDVASGRVAGTGTFRDAGPFSASDCRTGRG